MRFDITASLYLGTALGTPSILTLFQEICLPIFLMIGAGWCLDRKFSFDLKTLVKLNIYFFVPAFIFVRVTQSDLSSTVAFRVMAFTLTMILLMGLLSWAYAKLTGLPSGSRRALQLSTMFYNSGNYGIPLMALAFPEIAALQVFVLMTMNIATFSLGTFLAASGGEGQRPAWLAILRQPSLYAIALALGFKSAGAGDWVTTTFLWEPLEYTEQGLISFALATLGVQLSQTRPPPPRGAVSWALVQRLLLGPLLATLIVPWFGFSTEVQALLILGAGTPTAINTALLAHDFDADHRFATAVVFYSTLLSLITITGILYLLRLG